MKSEDEIKDRLKELLSGGDWGDSSAQREPKWILGGWWPDDEWVEEHVHNELRTKDSGEYS